MHHSIDNDRRPSISINGRLDIDGEPMHEGPLDLTIDAGSWTCLLGPSGVGKSTLLRQIANLPTHSHLAGSITSSDGMPVAPRISYMAQTDLLMPWASVLSNVTLGARLRGERADLDQAKHLLDQVGLSSMASRKPATLSGGERQRVALARTLMEDKDFVLLDEPFSALDAKIRSEMQDLAARLLHGRTILLVTHDPLEAARLGHAIIVMSKLGLQRIATLSTPVPRAVDDSETLSIQGRLLRTLRGKA